MTPEALNLFKYTGWWFGTFFFHILGIMIPTDELIFFRGVAQPPTSTCTYQMIQMTFASLLGSSSQQNSMCFFEVQFLFFSTELQWSPPGHQFTAIVKSLQAETPKMACLIVFLRWCCSALHIFDIKLSHTRIRIYIIHIQSYTYIYTPLSSFTAIA